MSPAGIARLKFFLTILAAIVLLHVIVIAMVVSSSGNSKPEPAAPSDPAKQAAPGKPGEKPEPSGTGTRAPGVPQTRPQLRYRRPSTQPNFGKPLNHVYARRGEFPGHIVPGDASRTGILIDADTRKVLWEKECHKPVPVASMSKMMTLLLTMEHLDSRPELSLETPVQISKEVLRLPSREGIVWLDPRETFPISDLVKCAAIKSANDAALQLALTVSGSEAAFVEMMNRKAARLGMRHTKFVNAHGLPDKNRNQSLSSAHDMVLLGERMLEYPDLMKNFGTLSSSIREGDKKLILKNTNRLILQSYCSAEGMKTGFTRKAGFCLTFSVRRNGRRVMGCVTGFPTARERDRFCKGIVEWAFAGCPSAPAKKQKTVTTGKKRVVRKTPKKAAVRQKK
ncbi:MAG: D-alanyl-D-alanine carboxypeptidase [Lentisphaeria bacterium]|nr:D-alanyl-D-alanine carboxypeptidase [Lentisphaeria bacterium]